MLMIRTDDLLSRHHLEELFTCGDEYDGPDLDECDVVPVCDGEWCLEEAHENGAQLWRFWRDPEADQ